jgi:hypothetical protein
MARRRQDRERMIQYYKEQAGIAEIDMKEVAKFAIAHGWPPPIPKDPVDLLAEQFAQTAREVIWHDKTTRKPYRKYHAMEERHGQTRLYVWIDIDEAPRKSMVKSTVMRREGMVADGVQLTLDLEHWNRINPNEEPINMPMNLEPDIEWRMNAPEELDKAG